MSNQTCPCPLFSDAEGEYRHPVTSPRYALCECGHSAAWHENDTGPCGWWDQFQSITCPRCHMTSRNLGDVAEGYCGHCHDWTTQAKV